MSLVISSFIYFLLLLTCRPATGAAEAATHLVRPHPASSGAAAPHRRAAAAVVRQEGSRLCTHPLTAKCAHATAALRRQQLHQKIVLETARVLIATINSQMPDDI